MHLSSRCVFSFALRTHFCVFEFHWVAIGIFVVRFLSCCLLLFSLDGGCLAVNWRFIPLALCRKTFINYELIIFDFEHAAERNGWK